MSTPGHRDRVLHVSLLVIGDFHLLDVDDEYFLSAIQFPPKGNKYLYHKSQPYKIFAHEKRESICRYQWTAGV